MEETIKIYRYAGEDWEIGNWPEIGPVYRHIKDAEWHGVNGRYGAILTKRFRLSVIRVAANLKPLTKSEMSALPA